MLIGGLDVIFFVGSFDVWKRPTRISDGFMIEMPFLTLILLACC